MSTLRLAPRAVNVERRGGNIYLRSPQKLAPYSRCVTEWLVRWSDKAPERTFLAERKGDGWRKLSYREAYGAVRRISQALLDGGLSAERPVAILSDNGTSNDGVSQLSTGNGTFPLTMFGAPTTELDVHFDRGSGVTLNSLDSKDVAALNLINAQESRLTFRPSAAVPGFASGESPEDQLTSKPTKLVR